MNKKGKSWPLFVVAILIVVFSLTAIFGVSYQYGDTKNIYIKGASDIRFGIDIRGGVDVTFMPAGVVDATPEQMTAAKTVIEAARLDGLSEIGIFFRMFVPIMRSTYGAAMTVTFMNAWNSYLWPKIIFQNNASITMPMLVANLKSGYSVDYGMLMLGVLICTLPTAIIFLCLQKSFANGITGAVK